jgi:SAM-dependent methyltransferase
VKLREFWDANAERWARFARTPGHDRVHGTLNLPSFLELLPPAGRATLDLGCGEGRVGAELVRRGHAVVGVDSSPRMVELARELHDAVVADASALPFEDGSFDLVVAYMSLMNFDDLDGAVAEAARVLEPHGRLCVSVLHPVAAAGTKEEPGRLVLERYYDGPTKVWESDREGIHMTFHDRPIPLSGYFGALEDAGLAVEALREPTPDGRLPLFLQFRAAKV